MDSQRSITNSIGYPTWSATYLPFGQEWNPEITVDHYKFTGKERDSESGLDNFGARYDSSQYGRFMTPDWSATPTGVPYAQLGDPQSLNLYTYVRNNPLHFMDADGHNKCAPGGCPPAPGTDPAQNIHCENASCTKASQQITVTAGGGFWSTVKSWFSGAGAVFAGFFGKPFSVDGPRAGKPFTQAGRQEVIRQNQAENGGQTTCENCGQPTSPGQQSQQGVTPRSDETNVDHIWPQSQGGDGAPSNGQILCRACNLAKGDSLPGEAGDIPIDTDIPIDIPF